MREKLSIRVEGEGQSHANEKLQLCLSNGPLCTFVDFSRDELQQLVRDVRRVLRFHDRLFAAKSQDEKARLIIRYYRPKIIAVTARAEKEGKACSAKP